MRAKLKYAVESALCRSPLPVLSRSRVRGDVLILAYHNIVPEGESAVGDGSLHLAQRSFARQLDLLARTHDIISLDALATAGATPRRPCAVITFDDAYQGAVTAGVAELAARGLPATIFVAPAFLDGGSFWWDVLADPALGVLAEPVRAHALAALAGRDAEVREWARTRGMPHSPTPPHQTGATQEQLAWAARTPGITLASHTWSHPNLAMLPADELSDELARPLEWLRERFAGVLPWISFPYGLTSPAVERAARASGYEGTLLVEGGWVPRGHRPADGALPRLNIPAGLSLNGFELRTAGVLGR